MLTLPCEPAAEAQELELPMRMPTLLGVLPSIFHRCCSSAGSRKSRTGMLVLPTCSQLCTVSDHISKGGQMVGRSQCSDKTLRPKWNPDPILIAHMSVSHVMAAADICGDTQKRGPLWATSCKHSYRIFLAVRCLQDTHIARLVCLSTESRPAAQGLPRPTVWQSCSTSVPIA